MVLLLLILPVTLKYCRLKLMSKKILFIVTQSEFGGAQHFLAHLVAALDKDKYDITVAAGPQGDDETGLLKFLEKKGINTKHLKYLRRGINPLFDLYLSPVEIFNLIKREKPDILFLCSSKAGAIGSLIGRLTGVKKIIYRIGGWAFNDPWPKWKKKLYILIEKWTAKFKDIIINNAESDREQAIRLVIKPRDKIIVIYNGIDVSKLEFLNKEEARRFLKIKPGFVIGTIANLYLTKGLEYLIEAARMLKNEQIKFIVIGEGQERKKLEKLIKKYNLENNFFLVGAIPDASKYLKAFDVFVLPSVKEGFPWTILEAMAAGIPIVATKVGAILEILKDPLMDSGQAGLLIKPGDSKGLSEAIIKLINNKFLGAKLLNQAKKVVKEKFTLTKMVKKAEELL